MVLISPKTQAQLIPCLDLSGLQITRAQFQQLCEDNPDLRLELSRDGRLIAIAPTFGISGERNSSLNGQLWVRASLQLLESDAGIGIILFFACFCC